MEIKFVEQVELKVAGLDGPRHLVPMEAMSGDTLDQFMVLAELMDQVKDGGNLKDMTRVVDDLLMLSTDLAHEELHRLQWGQKRAILKAVFKTEVEPPAQKKTGQ